MLVTQINRLERDIEGPLLERAERGRPMNPTALGEQVLAALHRAARLLDSRPLGRVLLSA
jgi:DNA-binding transcriptional LysR family regulator